MNFILNKKLKMYITISFFAYLHYRNHNKNKHKDNNIELKLITHKG